MKKSWLILLLLCFFAFVLRIYQLDAVSLRGDEAFTVNFVQRTWEGLWRGIRFVEPNPPALYLALRAWVAIAGQSEFATRFFSLWFGVLGVPLLFRLARSLGSSSSLNSSLSSLKVKQGNEGTQGTGGTVFAFIAAALIAFSPYLIWHAQDVRNYTLWTALSMTAMILFLRIWKLEAAKRPRSEAEGIGSGRLDRRTPNDVSRFTLYAAYVCAAYLSLMTYYYDTFLVVAQNAFFAFTFVMLGGLRDLKSRSKTLARWGSAQIVLVAAYGAWIAQTDRVATYGEASGQQSVGLIAMVTRTAASFVLGDTVPENFQQALAPFLVAAFAASLLAVARRNRLRAHFLALYVAVPILGVYVVSLGRPLFNERYLTGVLPAYFLLIAFGLAALWEWQSRWRAVPLAVASAILIVVAVFALANHYFDPAYVKAPNWRGAMKIVAQGRKPGDIVVQNFTDDAVTYYRNLYLGTNPALGQPGCANAIDYLPVITVPKDFFAGAADVKRLQELSAECQRIWFIPAAPDWWDPNRAVQKYLTRHDDLALDQTVSTLQVQLYLTPREFEAGMTRVDAQIGSARLVGYRVQGFERGVPPRTTSPATMRVVLYWRAAQKIEKDYTVFIHLLDADEYIAAQHDRMPVPNDYPTSAWQTGDWIVDAHDLAIDAPPGPYTLVTGMYDLATLARLSAHDASGARFPNDRVVLTRIIIGQ